MGRAIDRGVEGRRGGCHVSRGAALLLEAHIAAEQVLTGGPGRFGEIDRGQLAGGQFPTRLLPWQSPPDERDRLRGGAGAAGSTSAPLLDASTHPRSTRTTWPVSRRKAGETNSKPVLPRLGRLRT